MCEVHGAHGRRGALPPVRAASKGRPGTEQVRTGRRCCRLPRDPGYRLSGIAWGSDANQGYGDHYDEDEGYSASVLAEFAKDVTVSRVTDPWTPDDGAVSAAAGRRFAALEITVEGSNVMGAVYVSPMSFKLTDSEGFAYGALQDGGAEPRLAMIDLRSGEKTRGWLTFEVDESSEIRSLSYFGIDLELP